MRNLRVPVSTPEQPTFPIALAMCTARRALRPFLKRPDKKFIALLEMPPGIDSLFYHHGVADLLSADGQYDDFGKDMLFVARLDQIEIINSLKKVFEARRVVLLCKDLDELAPNVRLIADFEVTLARPTPSHFVAAARMSGLPGMTQADAHYLASLDFDRVKMAINGSRSLRSGIARLRRATLAEDRKKPDPPSSVRTPKRTLHDMAGYGEAANWGIQLSEDLAAWRAGEIEWEDVDRGAVLCGKPGTGKTTYGRLLAATCGVSVIEASSARWQAMGHLGDMLKAMRKSFEMANKQAPCILLLDEIDAIGDRESGTSRDNIDYKRQVINALLECLDPPEGRPGVVVVAATNFPDLIDPALLRPGRLERLIEIPMPDAEARVAILKHHLRGATTPHDLGQFVEMSAGYAGANIELVAREARRRARNDRRPLTEQDLLNSLPPSRPLTDDELRRVAVHEAGHAIIGALASNVELLAVAINTRVEIGGGSCSWGRVECRVKSSVFETEESLTAAIDLHLAGIAAERMVFGDHSTSGGGAEASDLNMATDIATRMERHFGFGDALVFDRGTGSRALEALRSRDPRLWQAVNVRLKASLGRTCALLEGYRIELEEITRLLVSRRRIEGAEVSKLISVRREDRENAKGADTENLLARGPSGVLP